MDTVELIAQSMQTGRLSPRECAEGRARLAAEYAFTSSQLEAILARKPAVWNAKRPEFKSDKACDRWYEGTEDGVNETGLRLRLKKIEKLLSALKGMQDILEGEARNQY